MPTDKIRLTIEAIDKTKGAFNNIGNSLQGFQSKILNMTSLFRGLAFAAPFAAIASSIMKTVNAGEEFLNVSKQLGISVENISTLKYAAEASEQSFEQFTVSMRYLSKALYGTNEAGKDTTVLLKQLGVTSKDPYQALLQIADAFKGMESGSGKAAIAMLLFGQSGLDMISMLDEGSEGIKKLQGEVKEFSTAAAIASDQFSDNMGRLKQHALDLTYTVGNKLIPILNEFLDILSGTQRTSDIYFGGLIEKRLKLQRAMELHAKQTPFTLQPMLYGRAKKELQAVELEIERILEFDRKEKARAEVPKKAAPVVTDEQALAKKAKAEKAERDSDKKHAEEVMRGLKFQHDADKKRQAELKKEAEDLAEKKLKVYSESVANEQKLRDENAVALENINKGELASKIKQYELEKEAVKKNLADILTAHQFTALERETIEREAKEKLIALEYEYRDTILANSGSMIDGLKEGFKQFKFSVGTEFTQAKDIAVKAFDGMADALTNFVMTGKLNFKDLANSIISDLVRIAIQESMVKAFGGTGMLIKGIVSLFGGAAAVGATIPGVPGTIAPDFLMAHSGGQVMYKGGYIPRFHLGGISSDEVLGVLQRGEYVVSKKGVAAMDAINQGKVSSGGDSDKQGTHNYFYIQAVDAKSFADLCRTNPGAISGPVMQQLRDNKTRLELKNLMR